MKYAFNDFVFDTEQLILYKNNEVLPCRHNETKLLALFLSEPQRIFSKDEILERVWTGKVVSEQAVFQNISLLRVLFGEDAIKTFPKKGYQWQLKTDPYIENGIQPAVAESITAAGFGLNKKFSVFILAAAVVVLVCVAGFWRLSSTNSALTPIALLPLLIEPIDQQIPNINTNLVQPIWDVINQTKNFRPVIVNDIKNHDDFFYAPQKYIRQITQQTHTDLVMVAIVGMNANKVSIRYSLKSEKGLWNAAHEAKTVPLLLEKLNTHIALILKSDILETNSLDFSLINAKLKILYKQIPDDLIILAQLANSEIQNGNTNNAILLADELSAKARLQEDKASEGEGYLIAAKAYVAQSLYADAKDRLQKALLLYETEQDYRALNRVQQTYAHLAFAENDYELFKKSMITAMQYARQAQDPLMEVDNSNYLSIVANKFDVKSDRQFYLDYAESILDQSQLSKEHYGTIYFYAGMYAETEALAEKNYRKVLAVLSADQDWWERNRALEHLTEILIQQSRWQEALDLFSTEPLKSSEEFMVGKIYSAQQLWHQAETHYLNAFKMANLTGQKELALDAALALLNIYQTTNQHEQGRAYKHFVLKEAENSPYWAKVNKAALETLGD
jgi:DNA-binding winged helix-turn-helix (wHTH) protein